MIRIAFFGHDAGDAAVRRRAAAFTAAGYMMTGFMMRRGENLPRDWDNIDLGQTYDAAYWQRLRAVFRGTRIARGHADKLSQADLIYARNLDMLICAMQARRQLSLKIPVVYECLDVHHLLTRADPLGIVLRRIERSMLRETSLLVYSSPAFEREFFAVHYHDLYTPYLIENRLVESPELPPRPATQNTPASQLRIGWFGVLRCHRSLDLLETLASNFPDSVEIRTRGMPAKTQVPDFQRRIDQQSNMSFRGSYKAPQDLAGLYADVDLVWAGDFYQAGYNSKWLLPNRIYEGGYFAVPAIAPSDSETGRWIAAHDVGFTVDEPLEENLPALIRKLKEDPALISEKTERLLALPRETFVQPAAEISQMVETALARKGRDAA